MSKLVRVKLLNDGMYTLFDKPRTFPVTVWADITHGGTLAHIPREQLIAIGANPANFRLASLAFFVGSEAEIL